MLHRYLASVAVTIVWLLFSQILGDHGSLAYAQIVAPPKNSLAAASPQPNAEVTELLQRMVFLERTIEQLQKGDNRINSIAPWIAITISCVGLFPLLLIWYEWSIRRTSEKKFDDFKNEARTEIDRSMDSCQMKIDKATDEKLRDKLNYLITSELRRTTQRIENEYGRDLARVDNICYSLIQNEFGRRCASIGVVDGVEYLHVFRHLLLLLVAGDGRQRQTALHRLRNEFVKDCGLTTRLMLGELLDGLERDARFARQELATTLVDLKSLCTI
jgi:hypothetical protein